MHVQGSGRRFATGGTDCLVKVWSLPPLLDPEREKAGPLVLATLSDHTSTVNTVRFSKNGKFLASGAAGARPRPSACPLRRRRRNATPAPGLFRMRCPVRRPNRRQGRTTA